ncbi:izumo sperm-egg fusion protein 2 isoform X1 [Dasypus novemcinctus]|uniref:izumo sperm-egg fusion protein 2 isoform X1 n=1 Tax=Dasypus novemcinctus TaxID=9361 RepID=UPI00265EA53B|nr:izumo sperm-egg fusion protein 2 isoform X2 [Dasypus novemcinctus]
MAVAVAVLLLGLARAAGGCLHCAPAALEALEQLRAALVPRRFTAPGPQSRAEALLVGMQGSFFRDYALDAFVGKVGLDELDAVASFTKNQTKTLRATVLQDGPLLEELVAFRRRVTEELKKALKDYEERACDATACHTLEGDVLDCFLCQNVRPQCIAYEECFVDRQPRLALQYDASQQPRDPALLGTVASVALSLSAFSVILIAACMYRQNRRLLLQ